MAPAKSTKSPAFQFFPRDFLSDELQTLLSLQEAGAYIRLICHCWLSGSLPDDAPSLAKLCGATTAHMTKMWPAISRCFKQRPDGRWGHSRLDKARKAQEAFRKKQQEKAEKSWQVRRGNATAYATALPSSGNAFLADCRLQTADSSVEEKEQRLDLAFQRFQQLYPDSRRKGGVLVEQEFLRQCHRAGGPHLLMAALQNHLASEQWQTLKLIPGMDKWLSGEHWRQTLPPPEAQVSGGVYAGWKPRS